MNELKLEAAIPEKEIARTSLAIESLNQNLGDGWALVGRFAIATWANTYGEQYRPNAPLNDVDIVASLNDLSGSGFLDNWHVGHWHPNDQYAAVVHRETGIKADVYRREAFETAQPQCAKLGALAVPVITAEEQLVYLALDLNSRTTEGVGFGSNQKMVEGIEVLRKIVQPDIMQKVWRNSGRQETFEDFVLQVLKAGREQPIAQTSKFKHIVNLLIKKCEFCEPPAEIKLVNNVQSAAIMVRGRLRRGKFKNPG